MSRTWIGARRSSALCLCLAAAVGCKQTGGPQYSTGVPTFTGETPVTVTATGNGTYTVDFGEVPVGQGEDTTVSLADTGTSPLQILGVDAPTDAEFGVSLSPGTSIGQGQTPLAIPVTFKPFSVGDKTAVVVVHTDSQSVANVTLNMKGQGVALKLGVDPQTLDFGTVVVHTSLTLPVTLTNNSVIDLQITPGQMQGNNTTLFSLMETSTFTLKAGQAQAIHLTFSPQIATAQGVDDTAFFILTPSIGTPVTVTLKGQSSQSGLTFSPNPLDFNFVQPGAERALPLHIKNIGNQQINISSISITNSDGAFAIATGAPQTAQLAGGQQIDVEVNFQPPNGQHYLGQLQVISNDNPGQVNIPLQGYGGGAAITCNPSSLAFGIVATGFTSVLPVICTNTGSDVLLGGAPDPNAELVIDPAHLTIQGQGGVFTAAIDPKAPQGPLTAGKSTQIDVSYTPTGTESDSANLTVTSNVTTPPAPPVLSLTGQGILESKCFYSLTPGTLNFGQVTPSNSASYTQAFTITNTGPNECLVNGVSLQAGSDPQFSLPNGVVVSQRLSPAGATGTTLPNAMSVQVSFAPTLAGNYSGNVGFTISDPDAPNVTVPLSGVGGTSCFQIKPTTLAFGVVGLSNGAYCSTGKKSFVGLNGCSGTVTINGVTMSNSAAPFAFISDQVPITVAPGSSSPPFQVGFKPTASGTYSSSALVQTDLQAAPFGVFFSGTAATGSQNTDVFTGHTPKVDVLLVMDTDDDLDDLRTTFATDVPQFVTAAENLNLDFHIAVTSTSDCPSSPGNGNNPNGEQGRIIPCVGCNVPGNAPTIITNDDPNAGADLANLVLINSIATDGCAVITDDEHFFDVSYKALVYNGPSLTWNNTYGFVRPDAYLAVIQTNGDDEDASDTQTPDWYANQFLSIKGPDHPELFSWSYINPTQFGSKGGHQPFNRLPPHIRSMLELVGGVALDISQTDWWKGVIDLWNIVLQSTTQFPLSGTPDPTSIQVYFDGPPPDQTPPGGLPGVPILPKEPNGAANWTYNSVANAVDLGSTITLTSSDTLYITYTLVCD